MNRRDFLKAAVAAPSMSMVPMAPETQLIMKYRSLGISSFAKKHRDMATRRAHEAWKHHG